MMTSAQDAGGFGPLTHLYIDGRNLKGKDLFPLSRLENQVRLLIMKQDIDKLELGLQTISQTGFRDELFIAGPLVVKFQQVVHSI